MRLLRLCIVEDDLYSDNFTIWHICFRVARQKISINLQSDIRDVSSKIQSCAETIYAVQNNPEKYSQSFEI